MVSCRFEEYAVVRHLHLQREYVNFHSSKRFKELGELYKSTEMSGFVNTTVNTRLCTFMPTTVICEWLHYGQKDFILLLTNPK